LEAISELEKLEKDIVKKITTASPSKAKDLNNLLSQTKESIKQSYNVISENHGKSLESIAKTQIKGTKTALNDAIGVPLFRRQVTENQVNAVMKRSNLQGHSSNKWWKEQEKNLSFKFEGQMRQGYLAGEDVGDLAKRVRGTKANNYKDGIMNVTKSQAETLVRSSVQTVSNEARLSTIEENDDIAKGVRWLSTLDGRTTDICKSLDGLRWDLPDYKPNGHDKEFPGPTAHWGCRSTQVPVLPDINELLNKPIKALDNQELQAGVDAKLKAMGMSAEQRAGALVRARASMDGQVPDTMTYNEWLKKKPEQFQNKVLGVQRAQLFRDGNLQLRDLTNQDNRPLTVEQLNQAIDSPGEEIAVETEGNQLSKAAAIATLEALPADTLTGSKKIQGTIGKASDQDLAKLKEIFQDEWDGGDTTTIRLDDLLLTQSGVSLEEQYGQMGMKNLIENFDESKIGSVAAVRMPDGTIHLINGHHRWAAKKLLGYEDIEVKLVNAESQPLIPKTAAEQAIIDKGIEGYTALVKKNSWEDLADTPAELKAEWESFDEVGYDLDTIDPGVREQLLATAKQRGLPAQFVADQHWQYIKQVSQQDVGVRISEDALIDLINGGKLKTAHETKTSSIQNGYSKFYMKARIEAEAALFDGKQPVYGYTINANTQGSLIAEYSPIEIVLYKNKIPGSTFTIGDSIDDNHSIGNKVKPASINSPSLDAYHNNGYVKKEQFELSYYNEVQIFDKVDIDSVQRIVLHEKMPDFEMMLKAQGIDYDRAYEPGFAFSTPTQAAVSQPLTIKQKLGDLTTKNIAVKQGDEYLSVKGVEIDSLAKLKTPPVNEYLQYQVALDNLAKTNVNISEQTVGIDGFKLSQDAVDPAAVAKIADSGDFKKPITAILDKDGDLIIIDGHTRWTAAKLRGDTEINVKVLNAEGWKAENEISEIIGNPKGKTLLAKSIKQIQKDQPKLAPGDLLEQAKGMAKEKQAAATKASKLSTAKKKMVEGKKLSPAEKKVMSSLEPQELASWNASVVEAKKAKEAEKVKTLYQDDILNQLLELSNGTEADKKAYESLKLTLEQKGGLKNYNVNDLEDFQLTVIELQSLSNSNELKNSIATDGDSTTQLKQKAFKDVTGIDPKAMTKSQVEDYLNNEIAPEDVAEINKKVQTIAAEKQAAATKASKLSTAKKKLIAGKQPSAGEKAVIANLTSAEMDNWMKTVKEGQAVEGMETEGLKIIPDAVKLNYELGMKKLANQDLISESEEYDWAYELSDKPDQMIVNPLKITPPDEEWDIGEEFASQKDSAMEQVPNSLQKVKIADLVTAQVYVEMDTVEEYLKSGDLASFDPKQKGKPPLVVKLNGTYQLHDGNHRATAFLLGGQEEIEVLVYDLDAIAGEIEKSPGGASKIMAAPKFVAKTPDKRAPDPEPKQATRTEKQKELNRKKVANLKTVPDPKTLKFVEDLGGSTGAKKMVDSKGKHWVVKEGNSVGHVKTESDSDDIYKALGFDTPKGKIIETDEGTYKVTEFIEGGKLYAQLTPAQKRKADKKLQDGFAVDAILGNWDVIGAGGDNVMVDPKGNVYRIDNGGTLEFRAQGEVKTEQEWNDYPTEIFSMRDAAKSPSAAGVYGNMTIDQIATTIERTDFSRLEDLDLPESVKRKLITRASEAKRAAVGIRDFQRGGYDDGYTEDVARTRMDLREYGIQESVPKKLVVSGDQSANSTPVVRDENGRSFGGLRAGGGALGARSKPKLPYDYYSPAIEEAIKSISHKAGNNMKFSEGTTPQKAKEALQYKSNLLALQKEAKKTGETEKYDMATKYLKDIAWIQKQQDNAGIPETPSEYFSPYMPDNQPQAKPTDTRSIVQRWESQMVAENINIYPIEKWLDAQSSDSWDGDAQAAKYAYGKHLPNHQKSQYWDGKGDASYQMAKEQFEEVARMVGGVEKADRLFMSYHAMVQETLSSFEEVPWVDKERQAVLLIRTSSAEEIAGSGHEGEGTGESFKPKRGVTESHSMYKQTFVRGRNTTVTAVPFSRIHGLYMLERTGGSNRSSFLGDGEAEVAANTSGLPTIWDNKYNLPPTDEASQSAENWGVPIDHL